MPSPSSASHPTPFPGPRKRQSRRQARRPCQVPGCVHDRGHQQERCCHQCQEEAGYGGSFHHQAPCCHRDQVSEGRQGDAMCCRCNAHTPAIWQSSFWFDIWEGRQARCCIMARGAPLPPPPPQNVLPLVSLHMHASPPTNTASNPSRSTTRPASTATGARS